MGIRYFFLWINAKTFENDRIARYYVNTLSKRACDIFGQRIHFDVFSTVHTNRRRIRFRFDSVFNENLLSVSVWTQGLNASKCMHFQTKTH